eukprot:scaffold98728_cov33-Phaeocystis_antarctica.AAC.2
MWRVRVRRESTPAGSSSYSTAALRTSLAPTPRGPCRRRARCEGGTRGTGWGLGWGQPSQAGACRA